VGIKFSGGVPRTKVTVNDKKGAPVGVGSFIVDTGASESSISSAEFPGGNFDAAGVVVFEVAGPGGTPSLVSMTKVKGGSMTFMVTPAAGGNEVPVTCTMPMIIGSINLLGNDQLGATGAILHWNAKTKSGFLHL
jgi:hypothetical protein